MSNPYRTAAGTSRQAALNDAPLHRARGQASASSCAVVLRGWRDAHRDALPREGFRSAEEDQALAE
ncbi:hypothetical protein [Actinacidiphila soli]|uniref:hypothetical protein n=1 Tax=Actinacidiphila soli TaxID=2487275 RepID=UPI000FC99DEE|nr:hypothetical protein [Actinacidiphila soli]